MSQKMSLIGLQAVFKKINSELKKIFNIKEINKIEINKLKYVN